MTRIDPVVRAATAVRLVEEWAAARGGDRELSETEIDAIARAFLPGDLRWLRGEGEAVSPP